MDGERTKACSHAYHDSLKRSPSALRRGTSHRYLWQMLSEDGDRMIGARCKRCHTDLAVTVSGDVSLDDIERDYDVDVSSAREPLAEVA